MGGWKHSHLPGNCSFAYKKHMGFLVLKYYRIPVGKLWDFFRIGSLTVGGWWYKDGDSDLWNAQYIFEGSYEKMLS